MMNETACLFIAVIGTAAVIVALILIRGDKQAGKSFGFKSVDHALERLKRAKTWWERFIVLSIILLQMARVGPWGVLTAFAAFLLLVAGTLCGFQITEMGNILRGILNDYYEHQRSQSSAKFVIPLPCSVFNPRRLRQDEMA